MTNDQQLTYKNVDKEKLTPMMRQYLDMKKSCSDAILMFRMGDFYEMFFDDAITAASALELALTGRDCGQIMRAPMCGVPHHAAASYMQKLLSKGYKVAVCDQIEDPAEAKGIVKRAITRILTPGTVVDWNGADEKKNNYLACIYRAGTQYGFAVVDITTGDFEATQIIMGNTSARLLNLLSRYAPSEIIANKDLYESNVLQAIEQLSATPVTVLDSSTFTGTRDINRVKSVNKNQEFDADKRLIQSVVQATLVYLDDTQRCEVSHLKTLRIFAIEESMEIDVTTRMNLEITQTLRTRQKRGSLLWAIDLTQTSAGGRLLRKWIDEPLINVDAIHTRQDAIEEMLSKFIYRRELSDALTGFHDIERLASKVSLGTISPRDLSVLRQSLAKLPYIYECAQRFTKGISQSALNQMDMLEDIVDLLEKSIVEDPPIISKEGGIIRAEYSVEVDDLRAITTDAKSYILSIESEEREQTGIKNLKIGYNRVFGYYIEVSKSNIDSVPEHYIRKQTLANGERYITEELKKIEDTILGANAKLVRLEHELFTQIRAEVSKHVHRLFSVSQVVAIFDVITALAELADRENYVRPVVDDTQELIVEEGRHPVVEKMLPAGEFIPNDTLMNENSRRIMILTGPNMAGKSTYMRQLALIVLLAQIGAFVPARYARIGIVDRIFTRIGASDDITSGQSTFMVEMNETASILRNATRRSLLLLDEIGRGTSTYDGLAIAWSILEFISAQSVLYSRTVFATHYHELNMLQEKLYGVYNTHVEVEEKDGEILFLHKITDGGTDDSYGIDVARLAGVPADVIDRARVILKTLEKIKIAASDSNRNDDALALCAEPMPGQIMLNAQSNHYSKIDPIRAELSGLDISQMTPLEAMNLLYALIEKAKNDATERGTDHVENS